MNNSGVIIWKGKEIGRAIIGTMDMWYVDVVLESNQSEDAQRFESIATKLNADYVIKNPAQGTIVELKYHDGSLTSDRFLVLCLKKSNLFMRLINSEIADWVDRKFLKPWQETDNPSFYENELKKEMSFFHPLNWRKFRAIALRSDRDDVLFELLTGNRKYAIVHLTWSKENSRKFPSTKFYKDWQDLYQNCILNDHKEWIED